MELKVGCLPFADGVRFAAETQLICSTARIFQPRILVEIAGSIAGMAYYGGPGLLMRLYPPPVNGTYHLPERNARLNLSPSEADQHELWKGWVATTVTEEKPGRNSKVDEMVVICKSYMDTQ